MGESKMATEDWNQVVETYERVVGHYRYGELAEKMLDLVNGLRVLPVLSGAKVWTSLLTLVIRVPKMSTTIDICWFEGDFYTVELPGTEQNIRKEKTLTQNEVGPVVERCLIGDEGSVSG